MNDTIPDSKRAIICRCGSVSFALRGDGFCECHRCGKVGSFQWEKYTNLIETKSKQGGMSWK